VFDGLLLHWLMGHSVKKRTRYYVRLSGYLSSYKVEMFLDHKAASIHVK